MEAKKYILLFYFIVNVSLFSYVSSQNTKQKMEILEQKSQLQALEIQLLQKELNDLREVTRNLQNSLTNIEDDTSAAIVEPPKDINDQEHAPPNWQYQVLKALKYEKMARFSMEERINSLVNLCEQKNQDMVNVLEQKNQDIVNLLEQKNQDMVNLLEQKNQDNLNMFTAMKAGLSSVNNTQAKLKEDNLKIFSEMKAGLLSDNNIQAKLKEDNLKMFAEIKADVTSVNNIQAKLKEDNLKMFAEMKAGLSSVNDIQAKLKEQLKNLTTGLMESKCTQSQEGINKSGNNCMIAFHAHLTENIENLEPWQTIVFDNVHTNHGNAYSGTNGTFTAPRPGMFVFYVHIKGSIRPMEVCLKKNNNCIALLYSQGSSNGYYDSDDNMAVVDLAKGDQVYTVKSDIHGRTPFYVLTRGWSNFAGYMLYPL